MANEITVTASLALSRSAAPVGKFNKSVSAQVDQTGDKFQAGLQNIGTSEENLGKGDIGTVGWVLVKNLDASAANYIELGTTTGQLPVKVYGGQSAGPFYVGATNVIAKATSTAQDVEYFLTEA